MLLLLGVAAEEGGGIRTAAEAVIANGGRKMSENVCDKRDCLQIQAGNKITNKRPLKG